MNAVKRPPRPQDKHQYRVAESNSSTDDLDFASNLQAKYILLKYLLSDARMKILSVRQAFDKLKSHTRL